MTKSIDQGACYHHIIRIDEPVPTGKPYRWQCTKCDKKLKIASGYKQSSMENQCQKNSKS